MSKTANLIDRIVAWADPERGFRRAVHRQALSSYSGGIPTRLSRGWDSSTSQTNVRIPTATDQRSLRDRARSLERRNPLAAGLLDRVEENHIGTGIQIEPMTSSPEFNKAATDWWQAWKERCDVTGRFHFDRVQRIVYRGYNRDGDFGVVLVDANGVGRLQLVEGDYIESPLGKYMGGLTTDGIETNALGAFTRFWIKSIDPTTYKTTYTAVPARDFIFLANTERASEIRGTSNFKQSFELFDMIHGYLEDTVTASRVATMFSLLIKQARPMMGGDTGTNSAGQQQKILNIESAMVKYLRPDESVEQVKPEQPTQNFPQAIAAFARFVGLKWGQPLEEVMLDFSNANFSVSRAIRMKIQRAAEIKQQDFAAAFVSRVYQWAIAKAIKSGDIPVVAPVDAWKHEWIPQPLALVDPNKEIAAARESIDLGVNARTFVAREMGYRFTDLVKQNETDRKLMEAAGLPLSGATSQPVAGDDSQSDGSDITSEMNAYGVGVRAGVITPQVDDENHYRQKLGIPKLSSDGSAAWKKDEGTRRPITITPPPGEAKQPFGGTSPEPEPEDEPTKETP